jgi:putative acetyltransferase
MDGITIRPEVEADHEAIRDMIVEVFSQTYGTGPDEADVVDRLREMPGLGPSFSLVATHDGKLIGHILYSPVKLIEHPDIPVCTLAPVGLYRDWQRKGIGSRLIREGLEMCVKAGYKAVFTTGSLEYYSRFGFTPLRGTSLHTLFNTEHDMALELEPGLLKKVSGLVDYPEPWHVFIS